MNSYLSRYEQGEHEAVWAELRAFGPAVRDRGHFDDAWAVARATMRRARTNIELIIERLDSIGFSFWDGRQGPRPGPPTKLKFGDRELAAADTRGLLSAMFEHALSLPTEALTAVMVEQLHNIYRQIVWPWQDTERLMRGERHPSDAAATAMFEQARKTPPQVVAATMLDDMMRLANGSMKEMEAAWKDRVAAQPPPPAPTSDHRMDKRVLSPPRKKDIAIIRRLDKAGLSLPLALAAWIEEVGGVNLCGSHPRLCFWEDGGFPGVYADPLMIALDLEELDARRSDRNDPLSEVVVGWDARSKARLTVEDMELDFGYTIALPQLGIDAPLAGIPTEASFVDYLRKAFRWGGFPGWDGHPDFPAEEIKLLTADLLPI